MLRTVSRASVSSSMVRFIPKHQRQITRRISSSVTRLYSAKANTSTFSTANLIQPEEVKTLLHNPNVRIIDCGSFDAYQRAHIPGAIVPPTPGPLIKDGQSNPTHIMNSTMFQDLVNTMRIGSNTEVLVYDGGQGWAAGYMWWGFKLYGHKRVRLIDGGIPRYIEKGGQIAVRMEAPLAKLDVPNPPFTVHQDKHLLANGGDVKDIVDNRDWHNKQLLDSRSLPEYEGWDVRSNMRGGHIPGSKNITHTELMETDGALKSPENLRQIFTNAGIDMDKPIITYCQAGMRGAFALLALRIAGAKHVSNYDASMKEWLNDPVYPVATHPRR